jgi:hypothetical protein
MLGGQFTLSENREREREREVGLKMRAVYKTEDIM